MQKRLPCKSYLFDRGIINIANVYYDICPQVLEDANRVLISYPYATACWNEFTNVKRYIALPDSLMDVESLLIDNQVVALNKSYLALATWIIWNGINVRLFKQVSLLPLHLMRKIQDFIFTCADSTKSLQCSLSYRYCDGFSLLNSGKSNHKNVGQSPPSYESIKVNFDIDVLTNKVIIGYVKRNSHGDLIQVVRKAISLYLLSYAEIKATWMSPFTVIKVLHYTDVYHKGDSSYVTSTISAPLDQFNET